MRGVAFDSRECEMCGGRIIWRPALNRHRGDAVSFVILPTLNTHFLHDPICSDARACGVEDGLALGGLDGGEDVSDVCLGAQRHKGRYDVDAR